MGRLDQAEDGRRAEAHARLTRALGRPPTRFELAESTGVLAGTVAGWAGRRGLALTTAHVDARTSPIDPRPAHARLTRALGWPPSAEELAAELGCGPAHARSLAARRGLLLSKLLPG
jgi:hypothetical protein